VLSPVEVQPVPEVPRGERGDLEEGKRLPHVQAGTGRERTVLVRLMRKEAVVHTRPRSGRHTATALLLAAVLAPPARALDFTQCTEPRHEGFDCATLPVPIDRDGMVPGT